ncbi:GNAT family N-acetyltransferase [Paenibacillus piri]|uniref:GNAT family N-acetyltransferase n=1 Tax=Paenibacillus piri TaxID=2547395 RepID=A0A4R5KXI2_9BACL|nr:GNAT family N-acetyltransferase [Paenibacillus piri]TDF99787.1 GNAT family N-acetyltransferase [Paenibacillus piri]
MYSYRDAKKKDFTAIAAFPVNKQESFYMFPKGSFPLDPEQLFAVSQTRKLPTVIERSGELAGYSCLYDVQEGECCWLGNVIINPVYRGQGAAAYLIETMTNRAASELGMKELLLVCHNTNTKALFLYDKMGFKPYDIKQAQDHDGNQLVGIKMRKPL